MSFIENLVHADRRHRVASGVVMPVFMPAVVLFGVGTIGDPAIVSVLVCVLVAAAAIGLYHLLHRLVLRKLTVKQQTVIGALGWLVSVPAVFFTAKYFLY